MSSGFCKCWFHFLYSNIKVVKLLTDKMHLQEDFLYLFIFKVQQFYLRYVKIPILGKYVGHAAEKNIQPCKLVYVSEWYMMLLVKKC